jgi:mono/diheme cytochrome c family protein
MSSWSEGALALVIVVGLGIGLFLFTGQSLGGGSGGESGGAETPQQITVDPEAAARGQTLAEEQGCRQCHTIDGTTGSGPTWKGLAGSTRPLVGGEEVVADDAYLFASIVDPKAQIVEGYQDVMPTYYADQLDEEQITDLVEYIKSLAG